MEVAHRLEFYTTKGPWKLTKLYDLIKRGMLDAQKIDGATFVTEGAWDRLITSAPLAVDARRKRTSADAS